MTTRFHILRTAAILAVLLAGCDSGPKSARGFRLPDGDVAAGRDAFARLECHTCHRVSGVEFPQSTANTSMDVPLGGKVGRIRTYGELVTSVINPSHGLAPGFKARPGENMEESPMPEFNDVMTVRQMIDIVAFLQSRYELVEPDYAPYAYP